VEFPRDPGNSSSSFLPTLPPSDKLQSLIRAVFRTLFPSIFAGELFSSLGFLRSGRLQFLSPNHCEPHGIFFPFGNPPLCPLFPAGCCGYHAVGLCPLSPPLDFSLFSWNPCSCYFAFFFPSFYRRFRSLLGFFIQTFDTPSRFRSFLPHRIQFLMGISLLVPDEYSRLRPIFPTACFWRFPFSVAGWFLCFSRSP